MPVPEDAMRCVRSLLIRPTWKRFSMQPASSMITTLVKSWIVMRQLLESEPSSHRCKILGWSVRMEMQVQETIQ